MSALRSLRLAGLLEGFSLLVLLLIAMPLKYVFSYPQAVRFVGSVHGLLFLWFLSALFRAHQEQGWPLRSSLKLVVAATLPFGFVVLDKQLTLLRPQPST